MQCKKSQHNGILKKFFANIITFKKKIDEHFGDSIRHKTKAITVLNTREIRITPKLSMDMAFPSWKLLLEVLFLTKLSLKMWKGFWQPRGTPRDGNGHEKWEVGVGIYKESLPSTLCQTSRRPATLAYVRWFLYSGSKGVSYVQVLPKGYSKSSVRLVVPRTSACTVCRAYIRWSPPARPH